MGATVATGAAEQVWPVGEAAEEVRLLGEVAEAVRLAGAAGKIWTMGAVEVGRNNVGTAAVIVFVPQEEIPTFIIHSEMVAWVKRARALATGIAME